MRSLGRKALLGLGYVVKDAVAKQEMDFEHRASICMCLRVAPRYLNYGLRTTDYGLRTTDYGPRLERG